MLSEVRSLETDDRDEVRERLGDAATAAGKVLGAIQTEPAANEQPECPGVADLAGGRVLLRLFEGPNLVAETNVPWVPGAGSLLQGPRGVEWIVTGSPLEYDITTHSVTVRVVEVQVTETASEF